MHARCCFDRMISERETRRGARVLTNDNETELAASKGERWRWRRGSGGRTSSISWWLRPTMTTTGGQRWAKIELDVLDDGKSRVIPPVSPGDGDRCRWRRQLPAAHGWRRGLGQGRMRARARAGSAPPSYRRKAPGSLGTHAKERRRRRRGLLRPARWASAGP
jgi:hypothetical protein